MKNATMVMILFSLVSTPYAGSAQARPDSAARAVECDRAAEVLTTGQPAHNRIDASWVIRRCPEGPHIIVTGLGRHRTSRDTALLNALTLAASELRDRTMYEAALTLFADQGASVEARVFAARMLAWQFYPNADFAYRDFVDPTGEGQSYCISRTPPIDLIVIRGAVLPDGWPAAIRATAERVRQSPEEPAEVREAALCFYMIQPIPNMRLQRIEDHGIEPSP